MKILVILSFCFAVSFAQITTTISAVGLEQSSTTISGGASTVGNADEKDFNRQCADFFQKKIDRKLSVLESANISSNVLTTMGSVLRSAVASKNFSEGKEMIVDKCVDILKAKLQELGVIPKIMEMSSTVSSISSSSIPSESSSLASNISAPMNESSVTSTISSSIAPEASALGSNFSAPGSGGVVNANRPKRNAIPDRVANVEELRKCKQFFLDWKSKIGLVNRVPKALLPSGMTRESIGANIASREDPLAIQKCIDILEYLREKKEEKKEKKFGASA